jgi:hypothetical protein
MTVATIPRQAERLINFLNTNGGIDSHIFNNLDGSPDVEAARVYAEKLRLVHKKYLNELITVEQKYNKVIIAVKA